MAIQHSKSIQGIRVLNTGSKDVVCEVDVTVTSYDDSDQEGTIIESNMNFELTTDGITSESEGWVAFDSLTEEIIYGWLGSELTDKETVIKNEDAFVINQQLNPPTPAIVNKDLPW